MMLRWAFKVLCGPRVGEQLFCAQPGTRGTFELFLSVYSFFGFTVYLILSDKEVDS